LQNKLAFGYTVVPQNNFWPLLVFVCPVWCRIGTKIVETRRPRLPGAKEIFSSNREHRFRARSRNRVAVPLPAILTVSPWALPSRSVPARFHQRVRRKREDDRKIGVAGLLGPHFASIRVCPTGGWGYNRALQKQGPGPILL